MLSIVIIAALVLQPASPLLQTIDSPGYHQFGQYLIVRIAKQWTIKWCKWENYVDVSQLPCVSLPNTLTGRKYFHIQLNLYIEGKKYNNLDVYGYCNDYLVEKEFIWIKEQEGMVRKYCYYPFLKNSQKLPCVAMQEHDVAGFYRVEGWCRYGSD